MKALLPWVLLKTVLPALLFAALILTGDGCATDSVVRDRATYRREVLALGHAASEMSKGELLRAAQLARTGDIEGCKAVADQALAISLRVPYHVAFMLFLGDMGTDPGPPQPMPTAPEWCLERAAPEESSK